MMGGFVLLLLLVGSLCNQDNLDELTIMKRTSCLVISRNYVNTISNKLGRLLESVPSGDQMNYVWKLYGHLGQVCENNISQSEMQEFYSSSEDFEIENFYYLLEEVDLITILTNPDLSPKQQQIVVFHKEFDSKHNNRSQEEIEDENYDQI